MTVSEKHGIPITEVIERKFDPEIQLYIRYYNHMYREEAREYEKMKKENERQLREVKHDR
jgi:hypothetical protein